MRVIEQKSTAAFFAGRDFTLSNTRVLVSASGAYVLFFLHGNLIARRPVSGGPIEYSCGGWHSRTASSRLRALGCPCHIKKGRIVYDASGLELPLLF